MGTREYRFVPCNELDSSPSIIVDGAATTGTILTLSHWPHSGTPAKWRRDTSTEIVFAYLDDPEFHVSADIVSNDHFDEDGLVGIFALINPVVAERHRDLLIDVANAGDFGVYKRRDAARIVFTISAYANAETSPLPREIFATPYPQTAGRLYQSILEAFPRFLAELDSFKSIWEGEDANLAASELLIDGGDVTIEEHTALDLAVIKIPEHVPREPLHPFAVQSRTKCSRVLFVQQNQVEFTYRYESWVQLASRRPALRIDLTDMANDLNKLETSGGVWKFDGVQKISPRLHLERCAHSSIPVPKIRTMLEQYLSTGEPAWNPYD